VIIFLGPPGSGKGTQAKLLADKYGFSHIATGDIFRWHMSNNTELGKRIREYLERGELVPDDITSEVVDDAIARSMNSRGIILDGYPRTMVQVEHLDRILARYGLDIDVVIYLKVSRDEALRRLLRRGRHDDRPDIISKRFDEYEEKTRPIREHYASRGVLIEIDGERSIEEVHESVVRMLRDRGII